MLGRLRSSAEFERLKTEGRFWRGQQCSVNAAPRGESVEGHGDKPANIGVGSRAGIRVGTRIGFITSKKIGSAVQRNRARRLMREAVRSLMTKMEPGWDIVIIARPAISAPGVRMQHVRDELLWLLQKAQLIRSG